jgi:hypothetical protein
MNMVMNQQFFSSYCDENGTPLSNSEIADINGLIRYQIEQDLYTQLYREGDSRKANSLKGIYNKENEQITFKAPIAYKFQGVLLDGDATRSWLDDYPIYRYADCLLALATAKAFLGEDISAEINEVRERAYGTEYFNEHRNEIAYPNDKDASFYANNRFVGSDDNPIETILKERMREFLFEGKRWYDIRLMGDEEIMELLPGKTDASKALIVGLRSWDEGMQERQRKLGIKELSPQEVANDRTKIMEWLKSTGVSKVVIHFDMDVLDPAEIIAAVGVEPNGMKIEEVVRIINDISSEYDLVGLTVAEPMPRVAIKLRNMLNQLPLLKD